MKHLSLNNKILYSFLIITTLLAWVSVVDKMAYELNIQSLKETSGAFVALKGVDSLITFAKSVPIIGKILSPYKDFLDRMSFIMLISFLSLGLQKVIIVAMQSFIINFILSINVIVVIANGLNNFLTEDASKKLFKLLVIMLFIRFAIPLQTFVITSIQSETASMSAQMHQERIENLEEKLINIQELMKEDEDKVAKSERNVISLKSKKQNLENTNESLVNSIKSIRSENRSSLEEVTSYVYEVDDADEIALLIAPLQIKIDKNNAEIKGIDNEIDTLEGNSFFNSMSIKTTIKTAMANINTFVEDMFDLFLTSVIMFFFTNVFFPVFFLWSLSKLIDKTFNTTHSDKLNASIQEKI